ncbi:MAG: protease complex subunit PrcB family protein [Bacteroidota bacterium]
MNSQQNILKYAICLVIGLLLLPACRTSSPAQTVAPSTNTTVKGPQSISFEAINPGGIGLMEQAQDILISSEEQWKKFRSNVPSSGKMDIDFTTHMMVGCFMGMKNSGGYSVKIIEIKQEGNILQVSRNFYSPGPSCMVTMAITYPYQIVKIPKMKVTEARFDGKYISQDCK